MQLRRVSFAGYRAFAARGPSAPARPLEHLELAPLTILLGKNNSGKSTVARLLHHVLVAFAAGGPDPFPMTYGDRRFGDSFRDVQHGGHFFNPLDLDVEFEESGVPHRIEARFEQSGEIESGVPTISHFRFDGESAEISPAQVLFSYQDYRRQARNLLAASCHLPPVRDPVATSYLAEGLMPTLPTDTASLARLLNRNLELRSKVGEWTSLNLEGWRADVRQSLELLQLVIRRGGREINLVDAGEGVQQVLPVVTLCALRTLGDGRTPFLDIVEQPELHLHDAAHAALGDLFLNAVANGPGKMVVETHSESLLLRIRRRVAEGMSARRVAVYFVEDSGDASRIRRIRLSDDGEAQWWPEGVFSEAFLEVKALRLAQRRREALGAVGDKG